VNRIREEYFGQLERGSNIRELKEKFRKIITEEVQKKSSWVSIELRIKTILDRDLKKMKDIRIDEIQKKKEKQKQKEQEIEIDYSQLEVEEVDVDFNPEDLSTDVFRRLLEEPTNEELMKAIVFSLIDEAMGLVDETAELQDVEKSLDNVIRFVDNQVKHQDEAYENRLTRLYIRDGRRYRSDTTKHFYKMYSTVDNLLAPAHERDENNTYNKLTRSMILNFNDLVNRSQTLYQVIIKS